MCILIYSYLIVVVEVMKKLMCNKLGNTIQLLVRSNLAINNILRLFANRIG